MSIAITISKKYKKAQKASILWIIIFFITMFISIVLSLVIFGICGYLAYRLLVLFRLGWIALVGAVGLILTGGLIVFFNLKFILHFFQNHEPQGIETNSSDEPELFQLIEETVREMNIKFPNKVYFIEDINASVYYSNNVRSLFIPTPKNLNIGIGLMHMLTKQELKGILAHEFGHFSQKSMAIGNYVGNINRSIHQVLYKENSIHETVEDIARWNAIISFICKGAILYTQMMSFFLKQIYQQLEIQNLALSREMEFNADEIAATIVGYETYERPLTRSRFYDECWNDTKNFYAIHIDEHFYTKNIYTNFNQVVEYRIQSYNYKTYKGLADLSNNDNPYDDLRIEYENLWSSHPEIKERLENIKRLGMVSPIDQTTKATTIIKNLDYYEEALTEDMFIHSSIMRKNELSNDQFISLFVTDEKHYAFPIEFQNYFNEIAFELKSLLNSNIPDDCSSNFYDVFNAVYFEPIFKQNRAYKEIQLLHHLLQQKEFKKVKFETKYYNLKKESSRLFEILTTEAESYQPAIDEIQKTIASYFKSNMDQEKLNQLKELIDQEKQLESHLEFAEEFRESLNWIFEQNHENVIIENLKTVHEKNKALKTRLKEIITFEKIITFYTKEQIDHINSFIHCEQLFYLEGYNNQEVSDLFLAINLLEGFSNAMLFDQKNQFLRQFIPSQETELV
ncbi:M48 family metallopeptidase [Faecalibacter sp. LW9]|uniref:M48 family metallopeptidase n=1 Tax=Faecalibacter sp. LW9 TaxID=3103144 RepID=UPI002AFFC6E3|nr:M48 family metalloprotease [Faecalibacter sp. LW9]